jgi:hypothetical protein
VGRAAGLPQWKRVAPLVRSTGTRTKRASDFARQGTPIQVDKEGFGQNNLTGGEAGIRTRKTGVIKLVMRWEFWRQPLASHGLTVTGPSAHVYRRHL